MPSPAVRCPVPTRITAAQVVVKVGWYRAYLGNLSVLVQQRAKCPNEAPLFGDIFRNDPFIVSANADERGRYSSRAA